MRIHSTSQSLSSQDKWFYQNFLRSLCLDPYFNQYPRFSYNNILFNGSFFISVSMLPHGQSQFDFEYAETAHFPNLVRIFFAHYITNDSTRSHLDFSYVINIIKHYAYDRYTVGYSQNSTGRPRSLER